MAPDDLRENSRSPSCGLPAAITRGRRMLDKVVSVLAAMSGRKRDLAIALALTVLGAWVARPMLRYGGMNLGDEGYFAYGVERIVHGQVMYRDFNRNYAPAIYYVFVPLWRLFGPDLLLLRVVWLAFLCVTIGLTYLLVRPLVPRWAALWAALVPLGLPPPIHKTFVPLAAITGLLICKRLADRNDRRAVFVAGVAIGIVALFRQEVGAFTLFIAALTLAVRAVSAGRASAGAAFASIVKKVFASWIVLGLGVLLVWVPVLALFAWAGAIRPMFHQLVIEAFEGNKGMGLPLPPLMSIFQSSASHELRTKAALFHFPAAVILAGAFLIIVAALRRKISERHLLLGQWTVMAALMHVVLLQRADVHHLHQIFPLAGLTFAYLAGALASSWAAKRSRDARGVLFSGMAAFVLVVWACVGLWALGAGAQNVIGLGHIRAQMRKVLPLGEKRAWVFLPKAEAVAFRRVLKSIREAARPGDAIFVGPYSPLLYFLTGCPNPTPFDAVLPGVFATSDAQERIVHDLDGANVRVIVILSWPIDGSEEKRFPDYTPRIAAYVAQNFSLKDQIGIRFVYVRKGTASAPTPEPAERPAGG